MVKSISESLEGFGFNQEWSREFLFTVAMFPQGLDFVYLFILVMVSLLIMLSVDQI